MPACFIFFPIYQDMDPNTEWYAEVIHRILTCETEDLEEYYKNVENDYELDEDRLMSCLENAVENGVDFDFPNPEFQNKSIFHIICEMGTVKSLRYLLDNAQIDVLNKCPVTNMSPMFICLEENHSLADVLFEKEEAYKEAEKDLDRFFALACMKRSIRIVKRIVNEHPKLDLNTLRFNGLVPLELFSNYDCLELAEFFMGFPEVNINKVHKESGAFPLYSSCRNYDSDGRVTKLLLEHKDIDVDLKFEGKHVIFYPLDNNLHFPLRELLKFKGKEFKHKLSSSVVYKSRFKTLKILFSSRHSFEIPETFKSDTCPHKIRLCSNYQNNPTLVRKQLKNELGFAKEEASLFYSLSCLHKNGFVSVSESDSVPVESNRFFSVTRIIPYELAMSVCSMAGDFDSQFISSQAINDAFSCMFSYFHRLETRQKKRQ